MVITRFNMTDDDSDWKTAAKAVPELRFLKTLVTGLALVMGFGVIALVALMWIRLGQPSLPALPDVITMPDGAQLEAVTFANDWIIIVTDQDQLLLYDRSGRQRDIIDIAPE